MVLTAYIISAADQQLILGVIELPELRATAKNVQEIPAVVQAAAAESTGNAPEYFTVSVKY